MRVRNHVIGTAIRNTMPKTGYIGSIMNHKKLRTAAKTPVTTVAKLLYKYPMFIPKDRLNITLMLISIPEIDN